MEKEKTLMEHLEESALSKARKVKETAEWCEKHQCHKVQLYDMPPFCTECQREKIAENEQAIVEESKQIYWENRTIRVLKRESLVGDENLWQATFKTYIPDNEETKLALKQARIIAGEYLDKDKQFNTVFTGSPGVGKSHLAMAMLQAVNDNATPMMSCLFISVTDILRMVKDSFSNKESKYTEEFAIKLLTGVDLLVLDDLGTEASMQSKDNESSQFNQKFLYDVLNARSRTIITTNLSFDELVRTYNSKLVSRIHKGAEGHLIKFTDRTEDKRSVIIY